MKDLCRHCHRRKAQSGRRLLCWRCSQYPAIRARYPSESKYGRWADHRSSPAPVLRRNLLADGEGKEWLIVGTRPDGEQVVLEEAETPGAARKRAALLRAYLEGYARVGVERIGEGARA